MSIYDELVPLTREIMQEFKQGSVSLVRHTPGTGAADEPGQATTVTHALNATVKGVSYKYVRDGFAIDTDLEVTAATIDGVTPSKNDFIVIDGETYKIVEDMSTPAAGTRVVWKFIIRR